MSKKLSFKEALERRGAIKDEHPVHSASPTTSVVFLASGPVERPVDFIRLLTENGVSIKRARMALDRLAGGHVVALAINAYREKEVLTAADRLGVTAAPLESPSVDPRAIRDKQGLSQTEFACLYGLEVDTLKNWEQGRNAPDLPARILLKVIDQCPHAVIEARTSGYSETFANVLYVCKVAHHGWTKYGNAPLNPWDWQHAQPHWRVTYHPPVWEIRSKAE